MALRIMTGTEAGLVLKVVGRPLRKFRYGCRSVDLVVDGVPIAGGPLTDSLRTYAFALPSLDAGAHELTLRFAPTRTIVAPGPPTLAVYQLAIEGGGQEMRLAAAVSESESRVLYSAAIPMTMGPSSRLAAGRSPGIATTYF